MSGTSTTTELTRPERTTALYAITRELARSHSDGLQRQAEEQRIALRLVVARRWARRAEAASRRARAAANAVAEIA